MEIKGGNSRKRVTQCLAHRTFNKLWFSLSYIESKAQTGEGTGPGLHMTCGRTRAWPGCLNPSTVLQYLHLNRGTPLCPASITQPPSLKSLADPEARQQPLHASVTHRVSTCRATGHQRCHSTKARAAYLAGPMLRNVSLRCPIFSPCTASCASRSLCISQRPQMS